MIYWEMPRQFVVSLLSFNSLLDSCPDLAPGFSAGPTGCDPRETEFSLISVPYHCLLPDPWPHNVLLCGQLLKNAAFGIVSDWKPQITHCTVQSPLPEPLTNLTRSLQKYPRADFQHKSSLGETKTTTGSRKQNLTSKNGLKLTYNSRFFSKIT